MPRLHHVIAPLLLVASNGWAEGSDLQRCREIANPTARLACYDAITITQAPRAASAEASAPERTFGLAMPASESTQSIESHVPGRFSGWESKTRIRLANNQVWEISDGSWGAFDLVDPKVRIRRGAFGSYFLEIVGENRSPRVKRIE